MTWTPYNPAASGGALEQLLSNVSRLHPFAEIAVAVWLLYLLFAAWTVTRVRIVAFISVNLLALAVTDSFTPIPLWGDAAIVIFAGLVWLVAEHYARFQRQHPLSWSRLLRYPLQLLLPMVIILSLIMASGVFVPEIPPLVKDPYTIWKEAQGEPVQSFVGAKGIPPSSSVKPSSKSGYSRQDNDLGGGFNFDYSSVMTVKSSKKSYWRGETKSVYTGMGWEDSDQEKKEPLLSGLASDAPLPVEWDQSKAKTVEITQEITMENKTPLPRPVWSFADIGGDFGNDPRRFRFKRHLRRQLGSGLA